VPLGRSGKKQASVRCFTKSGDTVPTERLFCRTSLSPTDPVNSDTALIEVALANIAVADDYADWLLTSYSSLGGDGWSFQ
jgi:hypothetical protein